MCGRTRRETCFHSNSSADGKSGGREVMSYLPQNIKFAKDHAKDQDQLVEKFGDPILILLCN